MKTIIHIGQHKTATTSIQHYLKKNRKALIEQGLYVPDSLVQCDSPSHFLLNVYALAPDRSSPMKDKLIKHDNFNPFSDEFSNDLKKDIKLHYEKAKKKKCTEVIWSNEGLYLLNSKTEYLKLISLFENYSDELICVCTFRDKKDFLHSYTKHLIKQKLKPSKNKTSYRFVDTSSWLMDYDRKKNILEEVFHKTIYIQYDSKDMISIFLRNLGYKPTPQTQMIRLNISD